MAVDQGLGDVETQRRTALGGQEIEVVRDKEGIDGEDSDIVRKRLDEVENGGVRGGVRSRRVDRNDAVGRVTGDVDGTIVAGGTASGLEESGDEDAGGGDLAEV